MKKVYLLLVMFFIGKVMFGQLLTENFSYTAGTAITANGWTAHSGAGTNAILVTSPGLTYGGHPGSGIGEAISMVTSGEDDNKALSAAVTSGTAYASFLVNVSATQATGDYFVGLYTSSSSFPVRVYARTTAGGFNFGISKSNGAVTYEATVRTFGTTYFIVINYIYNAGVNDDVVNLWVDPTLGGVEGPATIPNITGAVADVATITAFYVRQGNAANAATQRIDAIIAGTTWAQVTPAAGTPSLSVSSSSLGFGSLAVGSQSASQSFNLSGSNLTGAPGNITVTAPSTDFQVSNDDATWGPNTTIAYATSTLAATPVYVRFTPQSGGPKSGNITFSGGGVAIPPTVGLAGTGTKTYYSKSTGTLTDVSNWGDVSNGSGTAPANFTDDGQVFIVANRATETLDANWTVSGGASKVVVGDGTGATELIIPATFTLTGTADVANFGTLTLLNAVIPTLGTRASGSTVSFAQSATVVVPSGTYYNLTIKDGNKTLASGTTTVGGNLILDNTIDFNGAGSPFSTVNLAGNFSMQNGATIQPLGLGDPNRFTLTLSGSGTQTLSGGDFYLFRLQTPSTPATTLNIVLNNANLLLGNATSGGLNLLQATHTLSTGSNTLTIREAGFFSATNVGTITGSSSSNLVITKTVGATGIGSIGFTAGAQVLNNFTHNSAGTGSNNLTLTTPLSVGGALTLGSGNIITTSTNLLTLLAGATESGGTAAGFISGPIARETNSTAAISFPVGKNGAYRPVSVIPASAAASSYTAEFFDAGFSPTTLCDARLDAVATNEYWDVAKNSGANASVMLDYTAGSSWSNATNPDGTKAVVVAHYTGTCWQDETGSFVLGTSGPAAITSKVLTSFSPFAFGYGPLSTLPVSFTSVKASQQASGIKVEWSNLTETDILNYEIERSADGRSFITIGTASPRSNSGGRADYTYLDLTAADGVNYYRINAKGTNAGSKYSIIVKVNTKGGKTDITVYPNPVSGNQVSFQATALPKGQYTIRVTNATGQQVYNKVLVHNGGAVTEALQLPASIQTGIYNLQVTSGEIKLTKTFVIR
ncbi:MAG: T9SS type A sorting domain-containing protein [Chitinophagaceae bacterium]